MKSISKEWTTNWLQWMRAIEQEHWPNMGSVVRPFPGKHSIRMWYRLKQRGQKLEEYFGKPNDRAWKMLHQTHYEREQFDGLAHENAFFIFDKMGPFYVWTRIRSIFELQSRIYSHSRKVNYFPQAEGTDAFSSMGHFKHTVKAGQYFPEERPQFALVGEPRDVKYVYLTRQPLALVPPAEIQQTGHQFCLNCDRYWIPSREQRRMLEMGFGNHNCPCGREVKKPERHEMVL